jgi:hypothetical protein
VITNLRKCFIELVVEIIKEEYGEKDVDVV